MQKAHRPLMLAVALLLLFNAPTLSAQTADEWTTWWYSPSNYFNDFPRSVASAGKGFYVMASQREVHRTTDAGVTWSVVLSLSRSYASSLTGVAHPGRERILVIRDSIYHPEGDDAHVASILLSSDGGASWSGADRVRPGIVTSISMIDELRGIAGFAGLLKSADSILVTSDGGVSWRGTPAPFGTRYPDEVTALGPSTWYARAYDTGALRHGLYRTTDAGATWTGTLLPEGIYGFAIVDEQTVVGVGGIQPPEGSDELARDLIMRSTDAGTTWSVTLDAPLKWSWGLAAVTFADANNGIACGSLGQIFRTTDGGRTWEQGWMPTARITEYSHIIDLAYPVADEAIGVTGRFGVVGYRGRRTLVRPDIVTPVPSVELQPLEATITWTSVAGATGYDVQVADTVFEFNTVNHRYFDEPYVERTGMTDTSLAVVFEPHKRYIIHVRARSGAMVGDWSVRVYLRTEGEGKILPAPTITSPTNGATNQQLELDLTWTDVPTAIGYDYRVALEPSFLHTHEDVENHQGTTARVTGLEPNKRHYLRVRARDADGVMSEYVSISFVTGSISSVDGKATIEVVAALRPNHTRDVATLHFSLARAGAVRIDIVDAAGSIVRSDTRAHLDAGAHALPIDVSSLASGRYFVRVDVEGRSVSLPVVVAR